MSVEKFFASFSLEKDFLEESYAVASVHAAFLEMKGILTNTMSTHTDTLADIVSAKLILRVDSNDELFRALAEDLLNSGVLRQMFFVLDGMITQKTVSPYVPTHIVEACGGTKACLDRFSRYWAGFVKVTIPCLWDYEKGTCFVFSIA
jgi:hypothetical protein